MNHALVAQIRILLDRLIKAERLSNDDKEVVHDEVAAAARALPRDGVVAALDRAVGKNQRRRKASVFILSELTDAPESAERIGQMLDDPDADARNWLVQTIGNAKLVQLAPLLNRLIEGDPDFVVRQMAIHTAGQLKSPLNLGSVLRVAQNDTADLRGYVLWTLKEYATDECRPFLHAAFDQPTSDEVGKVRAEWGKTKEDRVIAAWGLGKLGNKAAINFLVEMLDDPDVHHSRGFSPGVSIRAAQALSDIFGSDFDWHRDSVEIVRRRVQDRN